MAHYELWYSDDIGNRLTYISDVTTLEYVKVLGDVGYFALTIPNRGQQYTAIAPDRRIAIYRQPIGGVLSLDFLGMMRQFEQVTSSQGLHQMTLTGGDLNELMARRIAAYYAGSAQTDVSGTVDDIMKEAVRDNFVDNADYSGTPSPTRSISALGFSVAADTSAADSINKGFAWRNILTLLQDLQAYSKQQGSEVFWGVIPTTETTSQFRTWITPRDRTTTSGVNPLVFSLEWGNLDSPRLVDDYSEEANFVYGGGQGEEGARIIQTASDTSRMNASRFNRRESFAYSNGKTATAVADDAESELERKRPTRKFYGNLIDTPLTPYGGLNGWNLGDKVTVNYFGQYDVTIRSVYVRVQGNGQETIAARVES